jgi:hypothetical protein
MALSKVTYVGDGSTASFAVPFSSLDATDVKVYVDGVAASHINNDSTVLLDVAPDVDAVVLVQRETALASRIVDFQNAALLDEADLDLSADQVFYAAQEAQDKVADSMNKGLGVSYDADGNKVINITPGTEAGDAVEFDQLAVHNAQIIVYRDQCDVDAAAAAADVVSTNADVVTTNANVVLTNTDVDQTTLDKAATAADVVTTGEDVDQTTLDKAATAADVVTTGEDVAQTTLDKAATAADVVTTAADVVLTNADVDQTTLDKAATAADVVTTAALLDAFGDSYLGNKETNPALDNDGDPLVTGMLYTNSDDGSFRYYNGSSWVSVGVYIHPNHSGDVSSSGDGATVIGNNKVTYAKMQNISATARILGRNSAGAGVTEEITEEEFKALFNLEVGTGSEQFAAGNHVHAGDPYFDDVKLLLNFEGADAATTTNDESDSNHTITFGGNAQLDTSQARHGTSALLVDGSGDYVTAPDSVDWNFTGAFTMEGSFRLTGDVSTYQFLMGQWLSAGSQKAIAVQHASQFNQIQVIMSTDGSTTLTEIASSTFAPNLDQWYDVAVDFDGTTYRLYIDGVVVGSSTTIRTLHNSTAPFSVGAQSDGSYAFNGHAGAVRVTDGVARYAGAYTPATEALSGGSLYELTDSTILKAANIGDSVQAHDDDTAKTDEANAWTLGQTFKEVTETQYALAGTVIDPANGGLQYKTLSANTTFTESLANGQFVILMLNDGSAYSATYPTITWLTSDGSAPELATSGYTKVVMFKMAGTLYGVA